MGMKGVTNMNPYQNTSDKIIPREAQEIKGKGEIILIPIEKLHPHPDNPRKDIGDVTELADSIKKNGILQNLTVVPSVGYYHGDYTVIIGHRRLAASKSAGLKEVPCVICEMNKKDKISTMLQENMQRKDLSIYEQAQSMQLMLDLGDTADEIAEKTGISKSTVYRRVRLLKLDAEKFKASEGRQVTMDEYDKLFQIKDKTLRNELLDIIGTPNFENKFLKSKQDEEYAERKAKIKSKLRTFASEVSDTSGLTYVDWIYDYNKPFDIPADAKIVKYYFKSLSYGVYIYREKTADEIETEDKEKQQRLEKELIREELKAQWYNILERTFRLRLDFIKNVNTDKHSSKIAEFASNFLLSGNVYYYMNNDEAMIKAELFSAKSNDSNLDTNPMKNLLFSSYFRYGDNKREGCIDYGYGYLANDHLQNLYDFLISIGYEISDEEQAILDGTHELYAKAEEIS